jgi:hypothetical protein
MKPTHYSKALKNDLFKLKNSKPLKNDFFKRASKDVQMTHHGFFTPEVVGSQGLGQLRLAHTGGSREDEGSNGTIGVLQTHTGTADSSADGHYGLFLANDSLVQGFLHLDQPLTLIR